MDKKVVCSASFFVSFFPSGFSIFRPTHARKSQRERNLLSFAICERGELFRICVCMCVCVSSLFQALFYKTICYKTRVSRVKSNIIKRRRVSSSESFSSYHMLGDSSSCVSSSCFKMRKRKASSLSLSLSYCFRLRQGRAAFSNSSSSSPSCE